MSEKDLQNEILNYINLQPDFFMWANPSQGMYDPVKKVFRKKGGFNITGTSDCLGVFKSGHILALEIKVPGNKPTPEQQAFSPLFRQAEHCLFSRLISSRPSPVQ